MRPIKSDSRYRASTMSETIFAKIIRGEVPCHKVYEDDLVLAFLDVAPLSPGHTLVIPKQHARTLDEVSEATAAALGMEPPKTRLADLVVAREAIDSFYRFGTGWGELVGYYAKSIGGDPFLETVLHDAVKLAFSPEKSRVKVCGNCGWLFIDRTRNANKRWCTKDLCGSRTRSRRHYHKRREAYNSAQKA